MRLVERVVGEVDHLVVDVRGHRLGDAVGDAAGHVFFRVPVDERLALPLHDGQFLLAHGAAHFIAAAERIARQLLHDAHHLLLVDDAAVGGGQDGLQFFRLVGDAFRVVLPLQVPRDEIHRARAVERDAGRHILQRAGLELLHEVLHARAFQLEHPVVAAGGQIRHDGRILQVHLLRVDVDAAVLLYQLCGLADDGECPQAQEIHLEEPQFLQRGHGVLGGDGAVRPA